jgi:mannose-6-phosphate isomerase-like protein (cupin superfamily)
LSTKSKIATHIDRPFEIAIFDLMLIRKLSAITPFVAGDSSLLKEILHPDKLSIDIHYSLAWASVKPQRKTHPHTLEYAEVYHIINGRGQIHIDNEREDVAENDTIYIPPRAVQFIENTGQIDLQFLCIVDPAWQPDIESIVEQGN